MKRSQSLCGGWDLFYFDREIRFSSPLEMEAACKNKINATVPGNFEIDLAAAGIIDKDLYKGMATAKNQIFEDYDWWYKTEFKAPKIKEGEHVFLTFGAVDCIAEYFLNGKKVYESDNAFIEQRFEITRDLLPNNTLYVHIRSAMRYAFDQEYNQYLANCSRDGFQAHLRKPPHSFGWDIFPRAVSGGIWKPVYLEVEDEYKVSDFSYYVKSIGRNNALIAFPIVIDAPYDAFKKDVKIKISGKCGDSEFSYTHPVNHCRTTFAYVNIKNPKLWWPYGYGEANVYDVTYELYFDGELKDSGKMNVGVRTVELVRTDTMKEKDHCFKFVVNGVDVMCKGANWVPMDAYHSKDASRYEKALGLFTESHCNIVRVWGGGTYEQEYFYDYCDRHGIMVWQDFCMACCAVPIEGKVYDNIEKEATFVVKTLRHHPSIILWSGDNEIDEALACQGKHSGMNRITRELLPKVVDIHDTGRPYIASSPYLVDEESRKYAYEFTTESDIYPERHLWGSRDYFKAAFYSQSRAHFVSETGYHGCPSPESVRKTVDEEYVWPIYNEQWALHSSDQRGGLHRVRLMEDQIAQLFAFRPDNIEDFSLASQISQAEAKKYFIERIRIKKPYTSGIIWWNMIDGWPQMSDAVVDYFYEKKLAFDYIKRSQEPVCLMIDEMHDWHFPLMASNDTLKDANGSFKVYDVMTKKVYAEGDFSARANSNEKVADIAMLYSDKAFLVIEWVVGGKTYYNHYLCGYPGFDFEAYKKWLNAYKEIIGE